MATAKQNETFADTLATVLLRMPSTRSIVSAAPMGKWCRRSTGFPGH